MPRNNKKRDDEQQMVSNITKQTRVPELRREAPTAAYSDKSLAALKSGNYKDFRESGMRAYNYQQNLAKEQKKYSYNEQAAKNNTLDRGKTTFQWTPSDQAYLQRIYNNFGDGEMIRRTLRESNRTKDWEQKYGKSYDEILEDFLADQGNVKMQIGEDHPILTEIGTAINSIPTAITALPSLVSNLINPESELSKNLEKVRKEKSEENKYYRAGVKENTGEKGDKAIDMLNSVADRMAVTTAGKVAGTAIGGAKLGDVLGSTMAGLSEANQRLDDLDVRGVDGRQKYLTALGHGAVEGAGTALVGGWLDRIPGAKNLKGAAWNLIKGGIEGGAENAGAEVLHNTLDTLINKENSQKELNKAIFMSQGMSEQDAEDAAQNEQLKQVGAAALTGAGFGIGQRGVSVGLKKALPALFDPDYGKVDIQTIYEPDDNAKAPTSAELPKNSVEQPKAEIPDQAKVDVPEQPKGLQGEEFDRAKAEYDANKKAISDLRKENKTLKSLKQTKENKAKVADNNERIKELQRKNVLLDRDMYGKPTPVIEQLDSGTVDNLNHLKRQIKDAGNMFAGENGKTLAEEANAALDRYIESGNVDDYIDFINKVQELDDASRGNTYTLKTGVNKGKVRNFDEYFTENGLTGLVRSTEDAFEEKGKAPTIKALEDVLDFHKQKNSAPDTLGESAPTNIDPAHELAQRYAAVYSDFDQYGYDDAVFQGDDGIEQMAEDIMNGRDLTSYIDALDDAIDNAPDAEVEARMTALRDDLLRLQPNKAPEPEVPTVKPTDVPQQEVPRLNQPTATTTPYDEPGEGTDISKRYYSMKNSDLFQRSEANMKMLETAKESGAFNKGVEGRLQAQEDALNEYIADPAKAKRDNLTKQWTGGKDIDTAMLVLHDALEDGNQTDFNLAAMKQAEQLKQAGRELRATRDYAGTKEGTLSKAVEFLNDKADKILSSKKTKEMLDGIAERAINGDYAALKQSDMDDAAVDSIRKAVDAGASKDDVAKMIAMYRAVGKTGISSEALQKVNAIYDQITRENLSPTSKRRADLETDAFKVLASDIGGKRSWGEMWNAWRYLAMLGNPKTHLRNVIGNTTHYMVTEAKDNVAAVMEEAIDKMNRGMGGQGIERTKALLSGEDQGLIDKAVKDADDVAYAALNDSGNKYNVKNEIDRARNAFNNKALSKIDDLNSNLLDVEDYSALKRKYSRSMARYLKANGADESIFSATDDASKALLDRARAYAIDQAKQATFHEYSKLADSLTQFSNNMRSDGKPVHKAVGMITEGLLPFKKTPINILKQGGKYSPISIAKGLYKVFDSVKTGNSTASEAIEDLASGLTGTGIMGLGYFLAHQGFLTGGANEDYDVDNAETDQGKQNYALKIGNKSYTLDWLAPLSLPLFVGVELQKMMNEEDDPDKDVFDKAFTALSNIAEPITEMSMLQGIQNVLNELSYSRDNVLATFAANTATGYLSQGVPTLAGQVARAVDDTRRSTYSDQPTGFKRQFDKAWTKIENKVPFLSMMNEPFVDAKGNTQQNEGIFTANLGNNFGTRLLDQMLSPGYYKEGNITDTDKELNRLYDATGEDVYQNIASGKLQDGSRLSKEKFTDYQKLYGKNTEDFYDAMIQSDVYQQLDDAEKVETLNSLKTLSRNIADHEISGKELQKSQQKIYDIYKTQGVNGVIDYYSTKAKADSLGMSVDTYTKKEEEAPGSATQWAQDKENALNYGFVNKDGDANVAAYEKAVSIVGDDQNALNSYRAYQQQDFSKDGEKIPYLMNTDEFTDAQKGMLLKGTNVDSLGAGAKGAYDIGGWADVYYYYLIKNLADQAGDRSGKTSKKELQGFLQSGDPYLEYLSDEMTAYLMGYK